MFQDKSTLDIVSQMSNDLLTINGNETPRHHPDGRVVDVLAFLSGRLVLNPGSVKLTQVAIDSPPMQTCTVFLGTSRGDGLRQLATP